MLTGDLRGSFYSSHPLPPHLIQLVLCWHFLGILWGFELCKTVLHCGHRHVNTWLKLVKSILKNYFSLIFCANISVEALKLTTAATNGWYFGVSDGNKILVSAAERRVACVSDTVAFTVSENPKYWCTGAWMAAWPWCWEVPLFVLLSCSTCPAHMNSKLHCG